MVTMCKDMRGGRTDRVSCGKSTSSCAAASPGPQTPHRKPKQPSIIQQVQSEPAAEEKAWEGEMHPAWRSAQKHVTWSMFEDGAADHDPPRLDAEITSSCL